MPQAVANSSQCQLKSFFKPIRVRRMKRSVTVLSVLILISKYDSESPNGSSKISTTSSPKEPHPDSSLWPMESNPDRETAHVALCHSSQAGLRLLASLPHSRALAVYQLTEFFEKVGRIVRPRGSLGVILNTKNRMFFVAHPFNGLIVEVDVCYLDACRQRLGVDRESMVLRRNRYPSTGQVLDRLISAAVTKFQLKLLTAIGQTEKLMTQTNPKDWASPHELLQLV